MVLWRHAEYSQWVVTGRQLLQAANVTEIINATSAANILEIFDTLKNGTTVVLDMNNIEIADVLRVDASDVRISGGSSENKTKIVCAHPQAGIEIRYETPLGSMLCNCKRMED